MQFETIIGIEIHLELNTKTKMFSGALIDFNADPNTKVTPIDIAYPGTLPLLNKEAVVSGIKLAKALKMEIDHLLRFDRKNYFYPDLPKGFQITQQFHPIGKNGALKINVNGKEHLVEIERIHLEEDTARQHHYEEDTFIDYNRAGIPLIEIVTRPVIHSADVAAKYVETIRQIALSQNISDARMEQGSLRADVNLSLRPLGSQLFGTKVEIKNINTISNIKKAIENEIAIQTKKLLGNIKIEQETKRFDEATQTNISMRKKTGAIDYKYFREPNIPSIKLENKFVDGIKLAELPWEKEDRYRKHNINDIYLTRLLNDYKLADFFDGIEYNDLDKKSKILFNEFVAYANSVNKHVTEIGINQEKIKECLEFIDKGVISGKQLKTLVPLLVNASKTVFDLIKENDLMQLSDEKELTKIIDSIITPELKIQYKENPERVIRQISGQLMKITKAKANPVVSNKIIIGRLSDD
ncbi:Aspartyl/glutamyl-tRNA(Asn/Gln) amidotransferase subunit B [Mycoplasmopsis californica]|nr:Asp-tRNA(Asn)/Glu-tRNA(Gln) amidotransferase subunit GatB [Mycoplasmopsis equigenitalium]VEU69694.1 Aspartyl/glutamyl-tRNA(Asn/Gln) amidotransferase subunit B [Mycoplasmopsis californica]